MPDNKFEIRKYGACPGFPRISVTHANPAISAGSGEVPRLALSETRREQGMGLRIAKQRPEPFLLKMPVVGKNLGQPFFTHRLHRNTID